MSDSRSLPTLSVVMPNYNHAGYLRTSLPAILNQSVPPTEIIILDDASTDESVEVIQSFADRHPEIRFYRNKQNLGVIANGNRGVELAKGDYIYFGSADDEVLPGLFEKSLRLLGDHPRAAYCCTIGDWHELGSNFNWHVGVGMADEACYLSPGGMVDLERRDRLFIASHTTVIRRQVFGEVGKFIPELKWHADWFALYTAGFRHGICYIPEALARFNIFPSSYYKTGRRDKAAHRAVLLRILELLTSKEFERERNLMREAGSLFQFAGPMLSLMWRDPRYRYFITPNFLRKNLSHSLKLAVKNFVPLWMANLYFHLAGYRATSSK